MSKHVKNFGQAIALSAALLVSPAQALACADPPETAETATQFNIDEDRIVKHVNLTDGDVIKAHHLLYENRDDGGLYLVDPSDQSNNRRINESWWFEKLDSARWIEDTAHDHIEVVASFITGIGPEAARPFQVKFLLYPDGFGRFDVVEVETEQDE